MIQITTTFPRALRSRSMRYFATAFFLCGFMALLWGKIATLDAHAIWGAITSIRPVSCGAALIATWFSLRAVGQYDAIWHKILKTEVAPHWAASVGTRAIAIAQTVGFGAISAAVVRRHFLPAMTLPQLSALSVAVPATFMGCWSVYALCAVWWLGTGGGISPFWVALVSLGSMGLLFIVLLRKNRWVNDADAWHLLQLFCLTSLFSFTSLL